MRMVSLVLEPSEENVSRMRTDSIGIKRSASSVPSVVHETPSPDAS